MTYDFYINHHLLAVRYLSDGHHCSDNLKKILPELLQEWNIYPEQRGVTTLDNAAVNEATMQKLNWPSIGCFSHIIHLAVIDSAKLAGVSALLDGFKVIVTFKKSPIAAACLHKLQVATSIFFLFSFLLYISFHIVLIFIKKKLH
jgi:hypothetical protein